MDVSPGGEWKGRGVESIGWKGSDRGDMGPQSRSWTNDCLAGQTGHRERSLEQLGLWPGGWGWRHILISLCIFHFLAQSSFPSCSFPPGCSLMSFHPCKSGGTASTLESGSGELETRSPPESNTPPLLFSLAFPGFRPCALACKWPWDCVKLRLTLLFFGRKSCTRGTGSQACEVKLGQAGVERGRGERSG